MVTVLIPKLGIFDVAGQEAAFGNWGQGGLPLTPGMGSSHGRPHDFFQGWAMTGSEGRKSTSGVQGQSPQKLTFSKNNA